MFLIDNHNINDPRINLALEEYCLRNLDLDSEYLLFYVNDPSVIIGRHQNTLQELNHRFAMEKGIQVVRRISGGGAVYHDHGNLNFSFIRRYEFNSLVNIKTMISPIVLSLNRLGIPAVVNERNDIMAGEKKISGNAQFSNTKGIIIHGTLLFDSDLAIEEAVLGEKQTHIESRAPKSTRSGVANINRLLKTPINMAKFRHHVYNCLDEFCGGLEAFGLAGIAWDRVYSLSESKYRSWEWNFGRSPEFTVWKTVPLRTDKIDARIDVKMGAIKNIRFNRGPGEWPGSKDLVRSLKGQRYDDQAMRNALKKIDLPHGLGDLNVERFVESIY